MLISRLFEGIEHRHIGADTEINGIEYDSRKVTAGKLFVCVPGLAFDGHNFAKKAVEAGAAALVTERELDVAVPQLIVEDSRSAMADAASAFYGRPAKSMRMVGVTGTNGKTTTTYMLKQIAEDAGEKVGIIGTIHNMIGSKVIPTERTTPESADLQALLRKMADEGVTLCVMEVSSHSLVQGRVRGIEFDVGIFTNLTQDHLDYHKTLENYKNAKKILLKQSKYVVVNCDDPSCEFMLEGLDCPRLTFGIRERANICAKDIDITSDGVAFSMGFPSGEMREIKLNIPGLFSIFNAMGTAGAAYALNFTAMQIKEGLERLQNVSGRMENLNVGDNGFTMLLDYAHTPDALENVLKTVHGFARGRVITLFGCGGDRDKAKRAIMGEVAGRYSEYCIITSDNPRTENPMDIIRSVEEGVKKSGCQYAVIENRRDAIRYALSIGEDADVIILAGKGHETYQEINGVKNDFDEKKIVAELIKEMRQ